MEVEKYVQPKDRAFALDMTNEELAKELERIANETKLYRSLTIACLLEAAKRMRDA